MYYLTHSRSITTQHEKKFISNWEKTPFSKLKLSHISLYGPKKNLFTKQTLSKDFLTSTDPRCYTELKDR